MITVDVQAFSVFFVLFWIAIFAASLFIYEVIKYIVLRIDNALGFTVRYDIFLRRLVRDMRRRVGGAK